MPVAYSARRVPPPSVQYYAAPSSSSSVQQTLPYRRVSSGRGQHRRAQSSQGTVQLPPQNHVAHGVATGSIGAGFGPYAHDPYSQHGPQAMYYSPRQSYARSYAPSRYSYAPTAQQPPEPEEPMVEEKPAPHPTTATVPAYMWDAKDPELDDAMHNPDPRIDAALDRRLRLFSSRGWMNASAMIIILLGLLMLFAGYPIIAFGPLASINAEKAAAAASNATGNIPIPSLVDKDTPSSALTRTGSDGKKYKLVFSDEFETPGRSFYPGDDPYWQAVDFHYWPTGDLEWYDPKAATTADGKLVITMTQENIHGLNYSSAMLQSWNQFCFTTGYFEVSISMPGSAREVGFWPGAWSMGNLGRAGYGATTEGTWPYSYDACDLGTFPNQTYHNGTPTADATGGIGGSELSFLPGQRLSSCTCEGSDHPGPDVTVGRNAPEIDIVEARIDTTVYVGQASQSLQTAPFNYQYQFPNASAIQSITNTSRTVLNTYKGGNSQQALSAQSYFNTGSYGGNAYSTYAYEWWSDPDSRNDGYVQWYVEGDKTWKVDASSLAGDDITLISNRLIPEEPMSMILNFGMAPSFQEQDFTTLQFPSQMFIEYVRVYQREDVAGGDSISCSPPSHPTADYIASHPEAYQNPNFTTWAQAGYTFPRNRLFDGC